MEGPWGGSSRLPCGEKRPFSFVGRRSLLAPGPCSLSLWRCPVVSTPTNVRQCKLDLSAGDPPKSTEAVPGASPATTNPVVSPATDTTAAAPAPSLPEMVMFQAPQPVSTPAAVPPQPAVVPPPTRLRQCKLVTTAAAEETPAAELTPP